MIIGQIYRASNQIEKQNPSLLEVDGFPNFYYHTYLKDSPKIQFQRGIHSIAKIQLDDGTSRVPAIIVSSSPHRYGSETTPWEDIYDPDFGHVRYYGDNRSNDQKPEQKSGNKALLDAFKNHTSPLMDERINYAIPILFFERTIGNGSPKGYLKFHGYGVIESVELVTQYDVKSNSGFFSNYVFDMCVFSLVEDNEEFSWDWINARRDKTLSNEDTLKYAPKAWKRYISNGCGELSKIRRHVYVSDVIKVDDQMPISGSKEDSILIKTYAHYQNKRDKFEMLAMRVAQEVFESSGANFRAGWITKKTGDGGIDFVARTDISQGLSSLKMVILGQAKCESLDTPTNGMDIARTVARLKRGWIGVYVTTAYFSTSVQKEVLDDQYPIMLINGLRLAEAINCITYKEGVALDELFEIIDAQYDSMCKNRRPEEILLD